MYDIFNGITDIFDWFGDSKNDFDTFTYTTPTYLYHPTTINNGSATRGVTREIIGSVLSNDFRPPKQKLPDIRNVIFNPPATIVYWADGTKTVVKCMSKDAFSKEHGLAMAICKKAFGNEYEFHKVFDQWLK